MFSTLPKTFFFNPSAKLNLSSANACNLDQSKNLSTGKEFRRKWHLGLNPLPHNAAFRLTEDIYIAVENVVRKGEIACFLPYMAHFFIFKMSSPICFNLDQSKILSSGNGLM